MTDLKEADVIMLNFRKNLLRVQMQSDFLKPSKMNMPIKWSVAHTKDHLSAVPSLLI